MILHYKGTWGYNWHNSLVLFKEQTIETNIFEMVVEKVIGEEEHSDRIC